MDSENKGFLFIILTYHSRVLEISNDNFWFQFKSFKVIIFVNDFLYCILKSINHSNARLVDCT